MASNSIVGESEVNNLLGDSYIPDEIYQFKITLKDSDPEIWRRVLVPSHLTFWQLHKVIQDAMGWKDSNHLHQFQINGMRIEVKSEDPLLLHFACEDEDVEVYDEMSARILVPRYFGSVKDRRNFATYIYDFTSRWEHKIQLEDSFQVDEKDEYPICTEGKWACPPEICRGIAGYKYLLEILNNPEHPRYEFKKKWLAPMKPENFTSDNFKPDMVTFREKFSMKHNYFYGTIKNKPLIPIVEPNQSTANQSAESNQGAVNEFEDLMEPNQGTENEASEFMEPNQSTANESPESNQGAANEFEDSMEPNQDTENEFSEFMEPNQSATNESEELLEPNQGTANESEESNHGTTNESMEPNQGTTNESMEPNQGTTNESMEPNQGTASESVEPNQGTTNESMEPNQGTTNESMEPNQGTTNESRESIEPNQSTENEAVESMENRFELLYGTESECYYNESEELVEPNQGTANESEESNQGTTNESMEPNQGTTNESRESIEPNQSTENEAVESMELDLNYFMERFDELAGL